MFNYYLLYDEKITKINHLTKKKYVYIIRIYYHIVTDYSNYTFAYVSTQLWSTIPEVICRACEDLTNPLAFQLLYFLLIHKS